jgi:hypothetical protein
MPPSARGITFCSTFGSLMTRFELVHLLVAQARANGFEFRKWYIAKLGLPWETTRQAVEMLCAERRYYALLFSHEFASSFWKAGERITFQVPTQSFTRRKKDGTIGTVVRKGYTRRSTRDDAWRYHLRELAVAEEPLRYMRKYLRVDEDLDLDDEQPESPVTTASSSPQSASFGQPQSMGAPPSRITIVRTRLT